MADLDTEPTRIIDHIKATMERDATIRERSAEAMAVADRMKAASEHLKARPELAGVPPVVIDAGLPLLLTILSHVCASRSSVDNESTARANARLGVIRDAAVTRLAETLPPGLFTAEVMAEALRAMDERFDSQLAEDRAQALTSTARRP